MAESKIEWTEFTWSPTTGCTKVSPGCDNCYAERMSARFGGRAGYPTDDPFRLTLHPDRLDIPLRRKKPTTYFVDSMSDLWHPQVPTEFIGSVWNTMGLASQHTFQILTKRPQRMASVLKGWEKAGWLWRRSDLMWCGPLSGPLPNCWVGTSIESDRYTFRADHLRATPAAIRFLSLEPLLGPLPSLDLTGIDWVIVGGESGPGARPMHPDWARDIRDRCVAAGVPFFFKQWGAWAPEQVVLKRPLKIGTDFYPNETETFQVDGMRRVGKKAAGRILDGRTWDEMPERPS